jgi:hypothetical protein
MKSLSTLVFIIVAVIALPASGKDDALQALEYQFVVGRDDRETLKQIQLEIEQQLKVIDIEDFKGGVDCMKIGKKGGKRDAATYVCTTEQHVYSVMTSVYYENLDAHSPVNDVSMSVTPTVTSCSSHGCSNSAHPGKQPCVTVTSNGTLWCRDYQFLNSPLHNCP